MANATISKKKFASGLGNLGPLTRVALAVETDQIAECIRVLTKDELSKILPPLYLGLRHRIALLEALLDAKEVEHGTHAETLLLFVEDVRATGNEAVKKLKTAQTDMARSGGIAKTKKGKGALKKIAHGKVFEYWNIWQQYKDRYNGKAHFARDMSQHFPELSNSEGTIQNWCRLWEKGLQIPIPQ